jgi:hypothetical protein
MTVKIRGQQEQRARKTAARPAGRKTVTPKRGTRFSAARREDVERYERKIAKRSPRMSPGARQFLAQMRADPDYRAVMHDLADK